MLENIEGAANSQDYIIIWGETLGESQNRTIKVFKSIRMQGLKLNKKKCQFNKSEVIFLVHLLQFSIQIRRFKKLQIFTKQNIPHNLQ